jgi:hypothetical protein
LQQILQDTSGKDGPPIDASLDSHKKLRGNQAEPLSRIDQSLASGIPAVHHGCVAKAELVIESSPEGNFLHARCPVCPQVKFNLASNTLEDQKRLRAMFDLHFRGYHKDDMKNSLALPIDK